MATQFSASEQSIGYYYQATYSLVALLNSEEEGQISIETLDDVVFERSDNTIELLQLKHHSTPGNLTDRSPDLWKTLRVWSSHTRQNYIHPQTALLTLVTTASCPPDSIAGLLRYNSERNPAIACEKLREISRQGGNDALQSAYSEFLALTHEQQTSLIAAIRILDGSPTIQKLDHIIKRRIEFAVKPEHYEAFAERLLGWWYKRVIACLSRKDNPPIARIELHTKINEIAEQFKPNSLTIDYMDAEPPTPPDPENDNRLFVHQLKRIMVQNRTIEKAILDYYRAFEQRSRWVKDDLLIEEDLAAYERRLVDEWERYLLRLLDENPGWEKLDDSAQASVGRKLFYWADSEADFRIRENVSEEYIRRGSFHILANENPPRVYWHPKFLEMLKTILYDHELTLG